MSAFAISRSVRRASCTLLTAVGLSTPALAVDFEIDLPAGQACADFMLRIQITGFTQVNKEFTDKKGNPVRFLSAGKGSQLTFINLNTGGRLDLRPNGSVTQTRTNPDGSLTVQSTGHNVVILFPTDVPAGPSSVQYVGRLVYTVDPTNNFAFTVRSFSGKSVDICAALS